MRIRMFGLIALSMLLSGCTIGPFSTPVRQFIPSELSRVPRSELVQIYISCDFEHSKNNMIDGTQARSPSIYLRPGKHSIKRYHTNIGGHWVEAGWEITNDPWFGEVIQPGATVRRTHRTVRKRWRERHWRSYDERSIKTHEVTFNEPLRYDWEAVHALIARQSLRDTGAVCCDGGEELLNSGVAHEGVPWDKDLSRK